MVWTIAHRGDSENFPDNSYEAFHSAVKKGFDMIELDIQLSKDKILYIYHDTIVESYLTETLSLERLKQLDSTILSLEEFFRIKDINQVKVYLDIKGNNIGICESLHLFLQDKKRDINLTNIYIASFNVLMIQSLHNLCPRGYQLGIILESLLPWRYFSQFVDELQLSFISLHWTMLDHNMISQLQNCQVKVFTYTCKDKVILSYMNRFQLNGIVTNFLF